MLSTKSIVYSLSPPSLREIYARIESSNLGYRLVRGAFWSLFGSLIARALGLVSAIVVGRMLGAESFGAFGVIQNTVAMFGTLAGFGMGVTANKHIAELKRTDPARASRVLGLSGATAWISSGVMAIVLFVVAPWLAKNTLAAPHLAVPLRGAALLLLLTGVNGAQTGALSGFEAFKAIARINLIAGIASFPLMLFGTWHWGIAGAVGGLVASQMLNCVLSFTAIRHEAARFRIDYGFAGCFSETPLFWSFSVPSVLIGVLNSFVMWVAGALLVNQTGGYGEMGIYSAALRIKQIPEAVLLMLVAPMLPILSEAAGKKDTHTYQTTLRFNFVLASLMIVPLALLQLAAPALTLMPFGASYRGHPEIVQWVMLHALAYSALWPMTSVLISMGRMWFSWGVNAVFALLFAAAAWWLVPQHGAIGLSASTVIAYVVANFFSVLFLYRHLPEVMRFIRWGTSMIALAICAGLCLASGLFLPFGWSVVMGALIACSFFLVTYRMSGRDMLARATGRS